MQSATTAHVTTATERRKAVVAGVIGNVLEWYDFAVYGYLVPVISQLFFPSDDPLASTLLTVYGHIERIDAPDCAVIHVIASRLIDHSALLGGLTVDSHDFR